MSDIKCSVCENPALDNSVVGPLCGRCLMTLTELRSAESYEQIETRLLAELVAQLPAALGAKISEIVESLGSDEPEESVRLTPSEAADTLNVLRSVMRRNTVTA